MKKRFWATKAVAHTSIWLGKRENDILKLKCMVLKKPKANSQCWNIKNLKHWSQKWDVLFKKGTNVMICAEAKLLGHMWFTC